jgi:tape measure domain-containing protein
MSGLGISFDITAGDSFSNVFKDLDRQTRGITEAVGNVGKGLMGISAGLGAAVGAATGVGLSYLAGMEKAEIGLETLTGSAKETERIMSDLQDFALNTPFEFDGMVAGTRRLIGMGMASGEATEMLKATADAVAAAGGGSAELDGVITALGQIQAKGKISAEEMNQLAERGIPAWKILGEEMGKTPAQLMEMASEGKLLADDALPALQKGFEDTFGGAAAEQASSFSGRLSNLKEQAQILAGTFAEPIFEPLSNAMGYLVEKMTVLSEKFQGLSEPVRTAITVGALLTPILMAIGAGALMIIGFIPQMVAGFTAITTAVSLAGPVLAALTGPIGLIIGGLIALGAGLVVAYNKVGWFKDMVDEAWQGIKNMWTASVNFISDVTQSVMTAIVSFVGSQLGQFKALWNEHGAAILQMVKNSFTGIKITIELTMAAIKSIFQAVWPIISNLVKVAWNIIKTVISNGVAIITGLIDAGMSVLKGDWSGAWDALKGIAQDIWHNMEGFFKNIDLFEIGRDILRGLIKGMSSMAGAVADKVASIANIIPEGVRDFLGIHSPVKKSTPKTKEQASFIKKLLAEKPSVKVVIA